MAWLVAVAIVVVVVHSLYSWWTARRLDRLHSRLDAAAAALDDQLVRRAEAAARLGVAMRLAADDADGPAELLAAAARAALLCRGRLDRDRETAENALSAAIAQTVEPRGVLVDPATGEALPALLDHVTRAAFARRFYNDAVRDVLVVRDRRIVRWMHLAGRAPLPTYLEMDDGLLPDVSPLAGFPVGASEN